MSDQELNWDLLLFSLHWGTGIGLHIMCICVPVSFYLAVWASFMVKSVGLACWSPRHCCAYPYCAFKASQHVHVIPVCTMKSCTNEAEGFTRCFHQWTNLLFSAEVDKLEPDLDTTLITHDTADGRGSLLDGQQVPVPALCSSAALLAVQPHLSPSTAWIHAAGVWPGRW